MIQWILIALVVIILLLGGWWLLVFGLALLAALFGTVIAAVMWTIQTVGPWVAGAVLALVAIGVAAGLIAVIVDTLGGIARRRPPPDRPLPPFRRPRKS